MKTLTIFSLIAVLAMGCSATKSAHLSETYSFLAVDSSGEAENPELPGTFVKVYDTLVITVTNGPYMKKPIYQVARKGK